MKTSPLPKMNLPARRPGTPAGDVDLFQPAEHAPPMNAERVQVRDLVLDDRIQPRERMDSDKITEYAELLCEAAVEGQDTALVYKDPLVVYVDTDGTKRVASGFHRTAGADKARAPELLAILRQGGIAEARLWAAGTNHDHGLPRNAADRRRVLLWFLDDAGGKVKLTPEVLQRLPDTMRARVRPGETVAISDHLIGYLCRVSQPTVSRLRANLKRERAGTTDTTHQLPEPEERVGLDGKTRRLPEPAAKQRQDLARPEPPTRPGRTAAAPPQRYAWPLPAHQTSVIDWRQRGHNWADALRKQRRLPSAPADVRRSLAGQHKDLLAAVKWGALAAGTDGDKERDEALALLFDGATKGVRRGS